MRGFCFCGLRWDLKFFSTAASQAAPLWCGSDQTSQVGSEASEEVVPGARSETRRPQAHSKADFASCGEDNADELQATDALTMDALEGDGINLSFFNLLWSKSEGGSPAGANSQPRLRVPDTVVFLFGQPHQWYFTSKNGGPNKDRTTILRKRRANLTLANIEQEFLKKAASRGVGDSDVVAYFISSVAGNDEHASLDDCNAVVGGSDASCKIEYLNKSALRKSSSAYAFNVRNKSSLSHNPVSRRRVFATRSEQQIGDPPTIHCASWRWAPQLPDPCRLDAQAVHTREEADEAGSPRHTLRVVRALHHV